MLRNNDITSTIASLSSLCCVLLTLVGTAQTVRAVPPLLLHSTMDDAQAIFQPEVSTAVYGSIDDAVPGTSHVTFEAGQVDTAARIDANGFQYSWPVDGPIRFHGDNFDFDDPDSDGGRLDFWMRFDEDPHSITKNTWVARTNWGDRYINYEFAGDLMVDVFSNIPHNERTNYERFRVQPREWSVYENIREGEWHVYTLLWRRNNGPHKAEMHLFIDGTQQGCVTCSDYNGNLPPVGSITDFFFSPQLFDNYIKFTIDEVYSFDSWDVSGVTGNFPELDIPEGVTPTYPMAAGYPIWGSTVPDARITFEFFVVDYENSETDCDLYVDDTYVGSTLTTSRAHTEISNPNDLPNGAHTYQVKCDNDRLVSPVIPFQVSAESTPTERRSFSSMKALFGSDN